MTVIRHQQTARRKRQAVFLDHEIIQLGAELPVDPRDQIALAVNMHIEDLRGIIALLSLGIFRGIGIRLRDRRPFLRQHHRRLRHDNNCILQIQPDRPVKQAQCIEHDQLCHAEIHHTAGDRVKNQPDTLCIKRCDRHDIGNLLRIA